MYIVGLARHFIQTSKPYYQAL